MSDCGVVQDLLPLYQDKVCSPASRRLVEEHLKGCGQCRQMAEQLNDNELDDSLRKEGDGILYKHARKEKQVATKIGMITAGILLIPVVVCLICNLATGHGLDWFFIVLTALLLTASIIVVPLLAGEKKFLYSAGASVVSLVLLLLSCCIYDHGDWFFLVTIPTLFGLSVVLAPIVVMQIPLTEWLSDKKGILVMLWDTVWLYATIIICGLHSSDPMYWKIAITVTTVCVLIPWMFFVIIRYLHTDGYTKAGIILWLCAAFTLFANDICGFFIDGNEWDPRLLHMDLVTWSYTEQMGDQLDLAYSANMNFLSAFALAVAGVVLFVIGKQRQRRKKCQNNHGNQETC